MKFKSDIEVQAGLRDGSDDIGTAGQLLSSTGTITNWIDQAEIVAAGATRVLIACKNTSGGTITKGTPVYQTGNVGATDVIEIAEADALISTGYLPAIGLLETDLINNAFGNVVITGELLNITTSPIDGVVPVTGDTIYLKSGGGLTLIKPTGEGNAIQNLGLVGKVSGGNAGSLTVASIMRQNDVPNLPEGRIWIGDGNTIVSDTVYVDEPNGRVGIGTTTPSTVLEVSSSGVNGVDISQSASNASQSGRLFFTTNTASEGFALFNSNGTFQVNSGGIPNNTSGTNRISIIGSSGNVGIGTTTPNSKLEVGGEIDASGGDGYRINGKPWAAESSNNLRLGDWDGEGFSTSIFDENTIEVFKVKDQGVIINCDRTSSTTYGSDASLVVGGSKFSTYGPGVVTLLNNDPTSQAGDSTGLIQFAIRDDENTSAGYTSASIKGTIAVAAGSGGSGAGILSFLTAAGYGNPTEKMRINQMGNVGIGTTSPGAKLDVVQSTAANGLPALHLIGPNTNPGLTSSVLIIEQGDGKKITMDGNDIDVSSGDLFINDYSKKDVTFGGQIKVTGGGAGGDSYFANGNVGIGTTTPSEKLAVVGTTGVLIDSGSSSGALLTLKGDGSSYGGGAQINIIGGSQDYLYYATNIIRSPGTPEAIEKYEMYDHKWTWDGNMGSTSAQPYTSYAFKSQGSSQMVIYNNNVGIGTTSPQSKLQVNGGVQLANDTAVAWAGKVGTFRYRTSGNNSYVDMCMQTGASTYAWVNIVTNSW